MTAWIAVVAPICLIAKCALNFIGLEYGNKFQTVTDDQLIFWSIVLCGCAVTVDFFNCARSIR